MLQSHVTLFFKQVFHQSPIPMTLTCAYSLYSHVYELFRFYTVPDSNRGPYDDSNLAEKANVTYGMLHLMKCYN